MLSNKYGSVAIARTALSILAFVSASTLSACGGGGGEVDAAVNGQAGSPKASAPEQPVSSPSPSQSAGSPSSGTGAINSPTSAVVDYTKLIVSSPSSATTINAAIAEDTVFPEHTIQLNFGGDIENVDTNQRLWVRIEGTNRLFRPAVTQIDVHKKNQSAAIRMSGLKITDVGQYEGKVNILVCADFECKAPVKGSPVQLPYKVDVRQRLQFVKNNIEVVAKLGDKPATQIMEVLLPYGMVGDVHVVTEPFNGPATAKFVRNSDDPTKGALLVDFKVANVGTYSTKFTLSAKVPYTMDKGYTAESQPIIFFEAATANYSVERKDGVRYVMEPEISFTTQYGLRGYPTDGFFVDRTLLLDSGVTTSGHTKVAGSATYPTEAEDQPLKDGQWWQVSSLPPGTSTYVRACKVIDTVTLEANCLPRGTYTVDILQHLTIDGVAVDAPAKVKMTIE